MDTMTKGVFLVLLGFELRSSQSIAALTDISRFWKLQYIVHRGEISCAMSCFFEKNLILFELHVKYGRTVVGE